MSCTGNSCAANERYILFSWWKCGKCSHLKNEIRDLLDQGYVQELDVSTLAENSEEMRLFTAVSPSMHTPALAVLSGRRLRDGAIGVDSILDILRN